jgi:hypothetical protein
MVDYRKKVKDAFDRAPRKHKDTWTMQELANVKAPYPKHGDKWGKWKFDVERLVLVYRKGRHNYEVDVERMTNSSHTLDWIFQVAGKSWASPEDVGQLVFAIDDLISPQANLCSFGGDKKFNPTGFIRKKVKSGVR